MYGEQKGFLSVCEVGRHSPHTSNHQCRLVEAYWMMTEVTATGWGRDGDRCGWRCDRVCTLVSVSPRVRIVPGERSCLL